MPVELLQELAFHWRPKTILDIFRFIRICKTAYNTLPVLVHQWMSHMVNGAKSITIGLLCCSDEFHVLLRYMKRHALGAHSLP